MKKLLCIFVFLGSLSVSWGINPSNKSLLSGVAIKGYDPVAYFTKQAPVKGSKSHRYEWKQAVWHFSSFENLKLFKASPEKYAPQYGGYCAYAVSQGGTANIDPTQFTILNDKLYLNYNKSINKKWTANREAFIEQADLNWPKLLKK